jgi:hypothetical protein
MSSKSICIYTALIGDYEPLREQPQAKKSGIDFICLTDDPNLQSETWTVRHVEPLFGMDPIRSQRLFKLKPHEFLPEFEYSLYIDNTISIDADPVDFLNTSFCGEFCVAPHSFRESVLDEFIEVAKLGFDDQSRVFEQLNHYFIDHPDVLTEHPYWGGMIYRSHNDAAVRRMGDIWYAQVLRYSRRDQLSMNVSLKMSGVTPQLIRVDNKQSSFHQWHSDNRDRNSGPRAPVRSFMPLLGRLRESETELLTTRRQLADAQTKAIGAVGSFDGGEVSMLDRNDDRGVYGPLLNIIRERTSAEDFDRLGGTQYVGVNGAGAQVVFARDGVIATNVTPGMESGERQISAMINGTDTTTMVISSPHAEGETSMFLLVNHGNELQLRRVVAEPGDDGFATLRVKIE